MQKPRKCEFFRIYFEKTILKKYMEGLFQEPVNINKLSSRVCHRGSVKINVKIVIIFFLIFCILKPAWSEGTGSTSGATFLNLGVGSRPLGMGEAFTAVPEDPAGLYYNPSVLGSLKFPVCSVMHEELSLDSKMENVSIAYPFYNGYASFNSTLFWIPSYDKTNINGQSVGNSDFYNSANYFSYGREWNSVYLGASLKYIYQKIDTMSVNSLAVDFGIMKSLYMYTPFASPSKNFNLGMSVLNVGTPVKNDPLPRKIRIGTSYTPVEWMLLSVDMSENLIKSSDIYDFTYGFDESYQLNTGLELSYDDIIFTRIGYKFNASNHLTYGIGINYAIQNVAFCVDTSYSETEKFGPEYSVTVSVKLIPKVITVNDRNTARKYYQQGIQSYMADDIDGAIESFRKSKDYNPYQKGIDGKIDQMEEIKKMKDQDREDELKDVPLETTPEKGSVP